MIKKILKYSLFIVILLIVFLIVKTLLYPSNQIGVEQVTLKEVPGTSIDNLCKAIQFRTISHEDESFNDTAIFKSFHQFLAEAYPLVHSKMKREVFHHSALLYTLLGSNENLKPLVLLAHQDVVPVVMDDWNEGPFSGKVVNETIWGRGTLDDKGSLIAIMEAVELLLNEGIIPERTLYLAFGDDEEVGGKGAQELASELFKRGVRAELVLDEGMVITKGIVPMIEQPVATIGTSEKGYLSVELNCNVEGGHSSMPNSETAISILSNAIVKITKNRPSATFTQPVKDFMSYIGPEIPWPARIVFANSWLFGGVLKGIYTSSGPGNATVRTTTAPTMVSGGIKDNVLPTSAKATVNFRLLPNISISQLIGNLENTINDQRVTITALEGAREPAPVSSIETQAFEIIQKTIGQAFEETLVSPTLMLGSSDSRFYSQVSENIYRFAPYQLEKEDLATIHGANEKISINNFKAMIGFYYLLIKNLQASEQN